VSDVYVLLMFSRILKSGDHNSGVQEEINNAK